MKRTVKVKNIIAFAAVLILLFSITAVPAYAEFPPLTTAGRRLGAFLLSAIQAINITLTSTAAQSPGADIMNYIADPLDVQYSYSEMWEDQPKIQIWDDYINIDGVEYTDIWLSNEAATKFQVDAYDFRSAYNIASNSNGTFVEGVGDYDGTPLFDVNGVVKSQTFSFPIPTGGSAASPYVYDLNNGHYKTYKYNNVTTKFGYETSTGALTYSNVNPTGLSRIETYFHRQNNDTWFKANGSGGSTPGHILNNNLYHNVPFDFDYVASEIPSYVPLDDDEGLMLRVPSNSVPELKQFVNDNPEFLEPGGAPIDVTIDPDIMNKLDDLINIIAPIIPVINNIGDVQFTINHAEPTPPIPDTPIVDATVPQVVQPIINEIQNQGDIISQSVPPIIESIPKIDEICNNIDTAPYHDLDTGLDRLPSFFLPFITDLRSALGIWHYVTEWLAQISTTFAFITGCLVGTSIMTPIYAAIAGFMCIKIYRRMTA